MQLHELQPLHKVKKGKRVGRGGAHGTYSGKGLKGQNSRAGRKFKPIIRELIKRYPKLRGYRFKPQNLSPKFQIVILNLGILEKKFEAGEKVNPEVLVERKIIGKIKGIMPRVKILGEGEITKALTIEGCLASKSAKEKIEKAGGTLK
ncbi:MAG: uL15 family ribosomal protein [bacterium]|nr:uL15 family ribosomal protein [bacterium]